MKDALIDIRDWSISEEAQAAPYVTLRKIHDTATAALSGQEETMQENRQDHTLDLRSDPAVPQDEAIAVGPDGKAAGKITDLGQQEDQGTYPMAVLAGLTDTVRALKLRVATLEEQMGDRAQDDRIIAQQMARVEKRLGMPTPHIPQPTPLETVVLIAVTFSFEAWHRWPGAVTPHGYLGTRHRHLFRVKAWLPVRHDDRDVEFIQFGRKLRQWCEVKAREERDVAEGNAAAGSCTVETDSETGESRHVGSWENPGVEIGTWSCERWCRELVREFDLAGAEVSEDGENGAVLFRPGCFHAGR